MPGFDRSGPMGAGPMTGGRRGMCGGAYGRPGNIGYGYGYGAGRGLGFRRGHGRGRGVGYAGYGGYPVPRSLAPAYPVSSADELAMLQAEAKAIQASLESIRSRILEIEKESSE